MDLIILGGNNHSAENQAWVCDLANTFKPYFTSVHPHIYQHWKTKKKVIDLDYELKMINNIAKESQQYIILGKSAGVILTLKGINAGVLTPEKCVFIGTPVHWSRKHNFIVDLWLRNYSIPTLFIQKSYDPVMLAKDLKKYLKEMSVTNYQLLEIPGNDHDYKDQSWLKDIIVPFTVKPS